MIRLAKKDELFEINEIIDDAKRLFKLAKSTQWQDLDGYPNLKTLEEDYRKKQLYVKELLGQLVGVIVICKGKDDAYDKIYEGKWLNEQKYYVIHRLAVKKEYYGMGIAKELMNFAETIALKDGVFNIRVDTMENNINMTSLLKKFGYAECGIIYLLREDVIEKKRLAFQKDLSNKIY